jgi:aspartate aminotransferase, cytoplasmic
LRKDPNLNHEYLPIAGLAEFTSAAQKLILGPDSPAIKEGRVRMPHLRPLQHHTNILQAATLQTISGTGAVHLGGLFLSKFLARPSPPTIYLSNPTWANHNPTGVDPTESQWKQIATVMRQRKLFPFFDCAYQGFASGNLAQDNFAIRYFIEQGFEMIIAQSFAKNFGLYGERAGTFHFVAAPGPNAKDVTKRVASQLAILQRSEISNPPAYGARIASIVLNDPVLFAQWEEDLKTMSGRIIDMRKALKQHLDELKTPGTWEHITSQIGMFSFTGISEAQVMEIRKKWHVYMTKNGRISMAGLNEGNVEYVAKALDDVVRNVQ